jgi:hypothetical protein
VVSRVLVLLALGLAQEVVSRGPQSAVAAGRVHEGLLGWDAGWYRLIAVHGYASSSPESLRFFPLVPILAHVATLFPGVSGSLGVLLVSNLSALLATCLLSLLAREESGQEHLSRRAVWLLCLAPPAFTLVMGYAVATLLACAIGCFLALRRRRWVWASVAGFLAGTAQPLGVVLVLPATLEALRGWRAAHVSERGRRLVAALAPGAGCATFLAWVGWRYGNALEPFRIQEQQGLRGRFVDPLVTLGHDARDLVHRQHLGEALHLPWVILVVALTVVALRRWPLSYGLFAAGVVALALSAANLDSFERYALCAFPLVLAGGSLTASDRVETTVLVIAAGGLVAYAFLAFMNLYVP